MSLPWLSLWHHCAFRINCLNVGSVKFSGHILLKPSLKDFEHYLATMWNECSRAVVWTLFGIALLRDWNENWPFSAWGHCQVFQTGWPIECTTLTAPSFRIWKLSAGISSPPLALFLLLLPKAHLTLHSRMSGSRWVITPPWLSRIIRPFFTVLLGILATSS